MSQKTSHAKQIQSLLGNSKAVVRQYGLLLLEAHTAHLSPGEVRELISSVEPGDEPGPRSVLARIRESIARVPEAADAAALERSLMEHEPPPAAFLSTLPAGVDANALPGAGRDLLSGLLDCLVDHLRRGVLTEPGRTWRALAELRHPGVVHTARQLFHRGKESAEMYKCLAAVCSRDVEDLLVKATGTATDRLKPVLVETLGAVRDRDTLLLLGQAAGSPRRAERLAAARALGRCRRKGAASLLLRLAGDGDPDVACAALDSIAFAKDVEAMPQLSTMVTRMGDPSVRARLASVAAVLGGEDARRLLASMLADRSPEVAAEAAAGLSSWPEWSKELEPQLSTLLDQKEPSQRAGALVALFPHQPDKAHDLLLAMLGGSDPVERALAAGCVRFIQSPAAVRGLVTALTAEQDPEIRSYQVAVVTSLAPATPLALLQPLLAHSAPDVRSVAAAALTHNTDPQSTALLVRAGQAETQPLVKRRISQALVRRCRRDSPDRLKDFLLDRDARVVATAVEAMEDLAGLEVVPFVGPLLGHPSNRVRANAVVTLFKMGRFDGLDHLLVMLEDPRSPAFASGLYATHRIGRAMLYDPLRRSPALVSGLAEWSRRQTSSSGRLTLDLSTIREGANNFLVGSQSPTLGAASLDITMIAPPRPVAPQSPEARLELNMNEVARGEPSGAARLKEHLTLFPGDQGARYLLLRMMQKLGEETEDLVEGYARETVGSFVNPYIDLGRVTKEVGDGTRAMEFYIRSFESSMQALERLVQTARERLANQDFLGTSRTLEVLGTLFPINPVLHATLGEHYLTLGDNERAYQELYRAHLAAPDHPVVALKLAASCVKTQRNDLAVIVLKNLISREESQSPYRAKAQQILDSMQARAKRREEERRAQEAEGREEGGPPDSKPGAPRDVSGTHKRSRG